MTHCRKRVLSRSAHRAAGQATPQFNSDLPMGRWLDTGPSAILSRCDASQLGPRGYRGILQIVNHSRRAVVDQFEIETLSRRR